MDVLGKYKLSNKIIAFCGDNCNTNFGRASRKGTDNVFARLTTSDLKMNIRGIGCAAHILHSALRTSADILPVDVQDIVNKIFQYFHICTVRVEELNKCCDFVNIEYKQVLGSVSNIRMADSVSHVQMVYSVYHISLVISVGHIKMSNSFSHVCMVYTV
jgi:hypothetical protein